MRALEQHTIAFVGREDASASSRAESLRLAGATVCVFSPERDLWAALGEESFDALILLVSDGGAAASDLIAALESDARSSTLPLLTVVTPLASASVAGAATSKSIAVLSSEASGDVFVQAVAALCSGERTLRAVEEQHRVQLEQFRSIARRADDARSERTGAAHDLRAILGIAFGFACNLRDEIVGPMNAAQREHAVRILEAIRDASAMLDRTKDSARMPRALPATTMRPESTRPTRAQRTLVDLAAMAESVRGSFERTAATQAKSLTAVIEPALVWGDALKLKQVLVNLVANAVKYSPPGGQIDIAVRWAESPEGIGPSARKKAELVVTNTGAEIAPEARKRIFDRGFRLGEHAHLPGQGLGLAIVQEVVTQHGGTVRVDSHPQTGTSFVVSLPADMRDRTRDLGVLLVPESEAAAVLIDAIRSARLDELVAMMADRPREFLDMAAACGAFVVVPRSRATPLSEALAEILTPFSPRSETP
ncbi:MAG TPA: HAMP domain-containing sensor histidine kinase [Polyangiaceae bacterium]|nr:HAMP domain-containing sensor histidine kinase [Polyangiaceae bacterium]